MMDYNFLKISCIGKGGWLPLHVEVALFCSCSLDTCLRYMIHRKYVTVKTDLLAFVNVKKCFH